MKNYFNYDFINKAIVGSNAAIKRANTGKGNEYRELCKMLEAHPDFSVVCKEIHKNENKKKYHGLTFDRMKEYIQTQPGFKDKLKELELVIKVAETKGAKYPLTKKWFLSKYPEYKENETTVTEEMLEKVTAELEDLLEEETDNVNECAA